MTSPSPVAHTDESTPLSDESKGHGLSAAAWIFGAAGIALALGLVIHSGVSQIADLLRSAGWRLLLLIPIHVGCMVFTGGANRTLLPRSNKLSLTYLTGVSLVREAVGGLLPTMHVGSEVSGIRLLMRRGVPGATACAVIVVELTLWMTAQLMFATLGIILLVTSQHAGPVARYAAVGLLTVAVMITGFVVVQRRIGLFGIIERVLVRVAGPNILRFTGGTGRVDEAVRELYRQPRILLSCVSWQFCHFMAGAVETWATLWILNRPIGFRPAIVLESLSLAVQTATFFVPAGVGTQEASLVLVGAAVGVSSHAALALALARRGRQIALGVPAIITWFWSERRAR